MAKMFDDTPGSAKGRAMIAPHAARSAAVLNKRLPTIFTPENLREGKGASSPGAAGIGKMMADSLETSGQLGKTAVPRTHGSSGKQKLG